MTDKEEVCQLTIKKHPVVNSEQEEEIAELNDPQDDIEQYTRKTHWKSMESLNLL